MWQPIETAPKDGTDVLLWLPTHTRKVWVGCYEITEHTSHGKTTYKREYWSIGSIGLGSEDPTYWMPLPAPPAA